MRKPKSLKALSRKYATRTSRDRVLIVCEGEKTEPNYFRELRSSLGLTNADIIICGGECGTDPKSVVEYAIQRYYQDTDFDRVYCVFDKDGHATYNSAIQIAKKVAMPREKLFACIKSVPCFEYWLILHFSYTTAAFVETGKKSPGDCAVSELRKHIPKYGKGIPGVYSIVAPYMRTAMQNSARAYEQASQANTDNPSTEMHLLIEYLISLSEIKV